MTETTAKLITVTYSDGALGKKQSSETTLTIPCVIESVKRAEYFAAASIGLYPDYVVITEPINYSGEQTLDLLTPSGTVRCDIYRTYTTVKGIELYCVRKNTALPSVFTLWTRGKLVKLYNAYISGNDSVDHETDGKTSSSAVKLILPQSLKAFVGNVAVGYARPKAYAAMSASEQASSFTIDSSCFFAVGDIDQTGKYQEINAAYDDVYLVQGVALKHRNKPGTEYLEVMGR